MNAVRNRLFGLLRLVRPLNTALFAVGTLLGAFLAAGDGLFSQTGTLRAAALAALAAALAGAGGNVVNDLFDEPIDRINRPDRPLPSGQASRRSAWAAWAALGTASVGVASGISRAHGYVAMAAVLILFAYAAVGKRHPALKNGTVALVVAAAFPFGGGAVGDWTLTIPATAFAFLATLAREVVKDLQDLEGDRLAGANTVATRFGATVSARLATAVVAATLLAAPVPVLTSGYTGLYLLLLLPSATAFLLATVHLAGDAAHRASSTLKWAMALGMLALASAAP